MAHTAQQIDQQITIRLQEFRQQTLEPRAQEIMNIFSPNIEDLRTHMDTIDVTLVQVREQFAIEKTTHDARMQEAERHFRSTIDGAEKQFTQYQNRLAADMTLHNELFQKLDDIVKNLRQDVDTAESANDLTKQQVQKEFETLTKQFNTFKSEVSHANVTMHGSFVDRHQHGIGQWEWTIRSI